MSNVHITAAVIRACDVQNNSRLRMYGWMEERVNVFDPCNRQFANLDKS